MKTFLFFLLFSVNASCFATLSFSVNAGHPRVFINAQRVADIRSAVAQPTPLNGAAFPQTQGAIIFNILPTGNSNVQLIGCGGTWTCKAVFDDYDSQRNHIFVREVNDSANPPQPGYSNYQITFQNSVPNTYAANTIQSLLRNQWHSIRISWDSASSSAAVQIDNNPPINLTLSVPSWAPSGQGFVFGGRDLIDNIAIYGDKNAGTLVANFPLDEGAGDYATDTVNGVRSYISSTTKWVTGNQGFGLQFSSPPHANDFRVLSNSALKDAFFSDKVLADSLVNQINSGKSVADLTGGHPDSISGVAGTLGMAFLVTQSQSYSDAIFKYADQLLAVPYSTGGEWTQGGRIQAMGIIYDWLFDQASQRTTASGMTYLVALSSAIRGTLTDSTGCTNWGTDPQCGTSRIQGSICGYNNTFDSSWACTGSALAPAFTVGGHQIWDNREALAAGLAIIDENPDMQGLLGTLYNNYFAPGGIYSIREWIDVDGGSQMGWAYGAGYGELYSAKLWNVGTSVAYADSWQAKQFLRYVYGLRGDYNYPALGDNFEFSYLNGVANPFALWAAASGSSEAPFAQYFYQNNVRPNLPDGQNASRMDELIYWKDNFQELSVDNLPTSRLLSNAGQILMRDNWDFPNSTLLEFKSTSFVSENHHHFDQNEFTLFYKKPLLVDSGYYDYYGSNHWINYYTRTIAHNTLTIWDPTETFGAQLSNDGGEQLKTPYYPQLADIQLGGSNHLDGVTAYEYTPDYTYTVGNASKAYSQNKLDQTNGFVRSLVFLRAPSFWQKPVTVVFDKVETVTGKENLTKRFLLHSLNEPEPLGGMEIRQGVYQISGNVITIRNGGGMVFSQTIMPTNPVIFKVGGLSSAGDFRFMAPAYGSTDYLSGLTNYSTNNPGNPLNKPDPNYLCFITPGCDLSTDNGDIGAWRVEITAPTPSQREYFLQIISVADNDGNTTAPPSAQNYSSDNATVVLLGNTQLIAFNETDAAATTISWNMPSQPPSMLITGLVPSMPYDGHIEASGDSNNPDKIVFQQSSSGAYTSSSQGTLNISSALPVWNADLSVTLNPSASVVTLGQPVTYTAQVANNGPSLATGVSLTGLTGCNLPVTSLASGASTSCTTTIITNAVGTLVETVNVSSSQSDANTSNNSATVSTTVNAPDLAPTSMNGTKSGKKVYVSDTVTNQGTSTAGSFTVSYYLSTDVAYDAGTDLPLVTTSTGTTPCTRTISSLAVGAMSSVSNKLCYKPGSAKTGVNYYVLAVDDTTNQVIESNEANNVKATTGTLRW